ncbi:hypothetical protein G3N58_17705 [Paraburkholderia sp. Ac-20342]|uniref:hypothetical protein n=1 Tax=Paraburkholderia sp. Ac-20342 TaxID=2703889 RepID=UPI00198017EC|nr:hypothetical protein [Paraburkholderia sp. Ac-20342]MBN3848644.1 hypothetical protein [Paraburkholderia sp. Ac-20342]
MSDDRVNHRKVYAKGYYDGIAAATGEQMTPERHAQLLAGQSTIAQKVYQVVPISGAQNVAWIANALKRATSSTPDLRIIHGCLSALQDAGLVRQPKSGSYQRDPDPGSKGATLKPQPKLAAPEAVADAEPTVEAKATTVDCLADVARRLKEMGAYANRIAEEIEGIALDIESDKEVGQAEAQKLRQLKSLLKELA